MTENIEEKKENPPQIITPPLTPRLNLVRERQYTHHSSDLSHSSINHIINYNENQDLERILNVPLKTDEKDYQNLSEYCGIIISKKFREAIKTNEILPSESDNKTFKLKISSKTKHNTIKERILNTINNDDPKIKHFINNTIDIILLREMKFLNRGITSIHNKTYNQIEIESKLKTRFFKFNYYEVTIKFLSITFL